MKQTTVQQLGRSIFMKLLLWTTGVESTFSWSFIDKIIDRLLDNSNNNCSVCVCVIGRSLFFTLRSIKLISNFTPPPKNIMPCIVSSFPGEGLMYETKTWGQWWGGCGGVGGVWSSQLKSLLLIPSSTTSSFALIHLLSICWLLNAAAAPRGPEQGGAGVSQVKTDPLTSHHLLLLLWTTVSKGMCVSVQLRYTKQRHEETIRTPEQPSTRSSDDVRKWNESDCQVGKLVQG